ncbi:hypothetical protein N7U66_03410 [Lacinutrix neustonica]|uniref:Uncharacterized protein n=1 Tax=Lacinutrix neustonica TaxID=2980107 RepID=A0A9E8SEI1_9FLAO|nr:hypothetical protein [Lacinutrix neustonica]WAC02732.1 hypothetical protein N7U66_03410 [Lacinutrix neustonica]
MCNSTNRYSSGTGINLASYRTSVNDIVPDQLATGATEDFVFIVDYLYMFRDNLALGVLTPIDNYLSRFTIPEGYTINNVTWHNFTSGNDANAVSLTAVPIGNNQYEVRGGGGPRGRYEVNVTVGCSDTMVENIGPVDWEMYVDVCGGFSSLELLEMASTNALIFTTFERCTTDPGGPGGSGDDICDFSTESFEVTRNSFGYVAGYNGKTYYSKSELGSVPRVTANTPEIELNAAYPLDKVLFSGLGTLSTDDNETYNQLSFSFAYNLP